MATEHQPLPTPNVPALTNHPDNLEVPRNAPKSKRISSLAETLRERLLIRLTDTRISDAVADAIIDILDKGEDRDRVALLADFLKQIPTPQPSAASAPAMVAIQINGGLRRGSKEFA